MIILLLFYFVTWVHLCFIDFLCIVYFIEVGTPGQNITLENKIEVNINKYDS